MPCNRPASGAVCTPPLTEWELGQAPGPCDPTQDKWVWGMDGLTR